MPRRKLRALEYAESDVYGINWVSWDEEKKGRMLVREGYY